MWAQAASLADAQFVYGIPQPHHGAPAITRLVRPAKAVGEEGASRPSFTFHGVKFTHCGSDAVPLAFQPLSFPVNETFDAYARSGGVASKNVPSLLRAYGENDVEIPLPRFWDLFLEHAFAPFFVFQVPHSFPPWSLWLTVCVAPCIIMMHSFLCLCGEWLCV